MDTFVKRVITVVVSLFIISYVGFQAYQVLYNPVKTETAYGYSGYKTIDTEGLAIRNETVIKGQSDGYLYYTIENGSRVSKDGTIAEVYPSETDSKLQQQLNNLEEEIALLHEIQAQGTANRTNLDLIDKQIQQVTGQITYGINASYITGIDGWRSRLLSLMNKRQITIGKVTDFQERISALTEQKNQIVGSFSKSTSNITSPVAGYFVSAVDAFENSVPFNEVKQLTPEKIKTIMESNPTPDQTGVVGKVSQDYEWYFACVVPVSDAGSLRQGTELSLVFPFVTNESIPATVVSANRDKEGNVAVVFQCSYMSGALSGIRRETVQIQLERFEGIRVPSSCVIKNDQGEQGVYTVVGDTVAFRKIEILHSEPEYVICKETEESGYLKMYDDIIIEGKGLYDGKIVR